MRFPLRLISLHDIHLFHDKTSTEKIIDRLESQIFNPDYLKGVNLILYAGDLLDQVLLNSDERVGYANMHYHRVLSLARQFGISIRLLHGTPSHDGSQGKQFETIAKTLYPDVDFKYVTDMEIEYIEKYDLSIMYVPDEWAEREVMYLTARKLLREHDLDKVDIILGHNQFGYQFNESIRDKISHLKEDDWDEMVRYNAFFGHVHKRSTYKKIEVAGSFDRLAHGEEEPKGFLDVTYYSEDNRVVKFVENKDAEVYTSITLTKKFDSKDIESYRELDKQVEAINRDSGNIRFIYTDKEIDMKALLAYFRTKYNQYRFTEKYVSKESQYTPVLEVTQGYEQEYVALTRENILSLILNEVKDDSIKNEIEKLSLHYINQC